MTTPIEPIVTAPRYPEANTADVAVKNFQERMEGKAMSYIKTKEAAERLSITTNQVTRLCRNGEIAAIDVSAKPGVGRPTYRISVESIESFERRRRLVPPPKPVKKRSRRHVIPPVKEYV